MNDMLMQLLMNRAGGGNTGVSGYAGGGKSMPQMGLSPEPAPEAQAIGMGAMNAASKMNGAQGAPMGGPAPNTGFNAGGLMGIARTALHGGAQRVPQANSGVFGGMLAKLMPMLQARQQAMGMQQGMPMMKRPMPMDGQPNPEQV